MSLGKRLLGLILIGVGALGIVVCLAGIAGLWVGGSHLQQANSRLFGQVDQFIVQVDRRAAKAGDAVVGTRDLVAALKKALKDSGKELLAERIASHPEIENIERQLASAMERADDLVEASVSTAELVEQLLTTIGDLAPAGIADSQDSSDLLATIRLTRESLAQASQRLADVERRLAEIRQNRDVDINLSEITKISLNLVARLDGVQTQIATFRGRLDETKTRLVQLHDKMRRWIFAIECLILVLVVWVGAGQLCLLLHGQRVLRRPT